MNNLVIKTHDFEMAKQGLREFSQKEAEEIEIDTVRMSGGLFGLGDHKVTGYELNTRLGTIQDHLIDINDSINRTIKEFGQVYNALEALDKDYIQAILVSIKATERTSESIKSTQGQIKKIVDDQKKTLEVLQKFKQKLDGYAHLKDIDEIWNYCQKNDKEIASLSNSLTSASLISMANAQKIEDLQESLKATDKNLADLLSQTNQHIEKLEDIAKFTRKLEKLEHLQNIDEMWNSVSILQSSLINIGKDLSQLKDTTTRHQANIEILLSFMTRLSASEHLEDIDEMWNAKELHTRKISELERQNNELRNLIQTNKEDVEDAIANVASKNDGLIQDLNEKVKYAYLIAGGSLGLALIELVVLLAKVM